MSASSPIGPWLLPDMPPAVAVLLLPGPGDAGATLRGVRAESGDAPIVCLEGTPAPADVPRVTPAEALTVGELLAPVRAGDRWRAGALAARSRPLAAHPSAVLGVAGHALVNHDGSEIATRPAPLPPVEPLDLLLRTSVEASAVLLRTARIAPDRLELLTAPHGDAVLFSHLVHEHGLLHSGEIAADVLVDPDRHGHAPDARTAALVAAVTAPGGDDDHSLLRRELLRRIYVEPDGVAFEEGLELARLLSAGADPAAVVADLQWALERQRDALAAERVRWAWEAVPPKDALPLDTDAELQDFHVKAMEIWNECRVRDAVIARLQAEIERRDAAEGYGR